MIWRTSPSGTVRTVLLAALLLAVGAALAAWGWQQHREQWWSAYLVAWIYWCGISLGSFSLLLLHNLTGGAWGELIRPPLAAAAGVLPVLAILALPILLQPERLYPWADADHAAHDPILVQKQAYLNVDAFQIRAAIYFALWLAILVLIGWHARLNVHRLPSRRKAPFSGQALALHGVAVTFASIDWLMSLEPHWYSTIYGVLIFAGQGLAALAFAILIAAVMARRTRALEPALSPLFHDLGKLTLAFVMLWAYLSFSQFFIIWNGNLPEEVVWYLRRIAGGWKWAAWSLFLLHFVLPFVLLLGRDWKRHPVKLGGVGAGILVMHWVEASWLIVPAIEPISRQPPVWLQLGCTLAVGGLCGMVFALLLPVVLRSRSTLTSETSHGGIAGT